VHTFYDPKQKQAVRTLLCDALTTLSSDAWLACLFQAGVTHAANAPLTARLLGLLLLCANLAQRTTGGARAREAAPLSPSAAGTSAAAAAHAGAAADASREALLCRCVDVFMDAHLALSALQAGQADAAAAAPHTPQQACDDDACAEDADGADDGAEEEEDDEEEDRYQVRSRFRARQHARSAADTLRVVICAPCHAPQCELAQALSASEALARGATADALCDAEAQVLAAVLELSRISSAHAPTSASAAAAAAREQDELNAALLASAAPDAEAADDDGSLRGEVARLRAELQAALLARAEDQAAAAAECGALDRRLAVAESARGDDGAERNAVAASAQAVGAWARRLARSRRALAGALAELDAMEAGLRAERARGGTPAEADAVRVAVLRSLLDALSVVEEEEEARRGGGDGGDASGDAPPVTAPQAALMRELRQRLGEAPPAVASKERGRVGLRCGHMGIVRQSCVC
jgi:hypothetical protein